VITGEPIRRTKAARRNSSCNQSHKTHGRLFLAPTRVVCANCVLRPVVLFRLPAATRVSPRTIFVCHDCVTDKVDEAAAFGGSAARYDLRPVYHASRLRFTPPERLSCHEMYHAARLPPRAFRACPGRPLYAQQAGRLTGLCTAAPAVCPAVSHSSRHSSSVASNGYGFKNLWQFTVEDLLTARASGRYAAFPHTSPRKIRTTHAGALAGDALRVALDGSNPAGTVLITHTKGSSNELLVVGMLSEKDYIVTLNHGSFAPADITAEQIMFTGFEVATLQTPAVKVLRSMLQLGRRHVPVLMPSGKLGKMASDEAAVRSATASGLELSEVQAVLSMREIVTFLQDQIYWAEKASGISDEALAVGIRARRAAARSGLAPADAAAIAAAATAAATTDASAAGPVPAAGEHSLTFSGALQSAGLLSWRSQVEELLSAMQERGSSILLNTRLDDNITVAEAANVMAERHMSCVAVVDDASRAAGVFTSRDFITRVLLPGKDATATRLRDVMTKDPYTAPMDRSVLKCSRSMVKRGFRHLPIVNRKPSPDGAASGTGAAAAADGAVSSTGDIHRDGGAEEESNIVVGILSMADVARSYLSGIDGLMAAAGVPSNADELSTGEPAAAAAKQHDAEYAVSRVLL